VELNVIGQDTTRYGRDVKAEEGLAALLGQLERIPEVAWIRLLYAYPAGVTDRLIETIGQSEKIVHYLDLPMQHVSDVVLRAMRRPDTRDRLQKRIEKLRSAMSDIVLRTTLIVGFPGETDEDFAELIDFVKWARFEALGAFPFYPEVGTPAAEMSDQVPEELKQERLDRRSRSPKIAVGWARTLLAWSTRSTAGDRASPASTARPPTSTASASSAAARRRPASSSPPR